MYFNDSGAWKIPPKIVILAINIYIYKYKKHTEEPERVLTGCSDLVSALFSS